jgi:hypothetical protein
MEVMEMKIFLHNQHLLTQLNAHNYHVQRASPHNPRAGVFLSGSAQFNAAEESDFHNQLCTRDQS